MPANVDVARTMLADGCRVAYIQSTGRGQHKRLRVTIGRRKPRRSIYFTPSDLSDVAAFARSIDHEDGEWLERYAVQKAELAEAQTPRPREKADAPKRTRVRKPKAKPIEQRKRERQAKAVARVEAHPQVDRPPWWPWRPTPEPEINVDLDAWDEWAPCRESPADNDDESGHDWMWSNSVSVFHSGQEGLPPAVRRVIDDYQWRDFPKHGDASHVFRVAREIAGTAKHKPRRSTRRWESFKEKLEAGGRRGESSPKALLTEEDVDLIRRERENGRTCQSLAEELGVSASAIWRAATGRTWAHLKPLANEG